MIISVDASTIDVRKVPTRCFKCKKPPKNCLCYTYRVERLPLLASSLYKDLILDCEVAVYVDNIATEPVSGEGALWQPRKNAKVWKRPVFVDSFLLAYGNNDKVNFEEVEQLIEDNSYIDPETFRQLGLHVPDFDKSLQKRLSFFHAPRTRKQT
jgi:hypothetical protein